MVVQAEGPDRPNRNSLFVMRWEGEEKKPKLCRLSHADDKISLHLISKARLAKMTNGDRSMV